MKIAMAIVSTELGEEEYAAWCEIRDEEERAIEIISILMDDSRNRTWDHAAIVDESAS